jgi:hypothetical protein
MPGRRISLSGQDVYGSDVLDRLTGHIPVEQPPASSSLRPDRRKTAATLEKVTLYLTRDHLLALEQERLRLYREGSTRVDRSAIVRRLIEEHLMR